MIRWSARSSLRLLSGIAACLRDSWHSLYASRALMKVSTCCAFALFVLGCSSAATNQLPLSNLNGTWTGQLKGFTAPGITKVFDHEVWITIHDTEADVWFRDEDHWQQVWNGARHFAVAQHQSNAVIFASHSKTQVGCHWVETWNFTVSHAVPNTLETFWYRIVNNLGCGDDEGGQFANGATGLLTKVSSAITTPPPARN